MIKTLTSAIAIPPIEGIAMGLATSAPAPVDHRMGIKPINVVAAVIMHGRILPRACHEDCVHGYPGHFSSFFYRTNR